MSTPTVMALSGVPAAAYGTSGIVGSPYAGFGGSDTAKGLLSWAAPESMSIEALGGDAGWTSTFGYAALNLALSPSSTNRAPLN